MKNSLIPFLQKCICKFPASLVLLLLIVNTSRSQSPAINARLVFTGGDTLSTEVLNEAAIILQRGIQYREPRSGNYRKVTPDSLISIKLADGRVFETVKCDSVSLLLLNILKGYYNLYQKEENTKALTFYLLHLNEKPYHLYETYTIKEIDGAIYRRSNYEYILQLKQAMADKLELSDQIHSTRFNGAEIAGVVKKYNKLKGESYNEERVGFLHRTTADKGILAGTYLFAGSDFPSFRTGLDLRIRNKYAYTRHGINTGLLYSRFHYHVDDEKEINNCLEVPILYNYRLSDARHIQPYISAGITFMAIYQRYKYTSDRIDRDYFALLLPTAGFGAKFEFRQSVFRIEWNPNLVSLGNLSVVFVLRQGNSGPLNSF